MVSCICIFVSVQCKYLPDVCLWDVGTRTFATTPFVLLSQKNKSIQFNSNAKHSHPVYEFRQLFHKKKTTVVLFLIATRVSFVKDCWCRFRGALGRKNISDMNSPRIFYRQLSSSYVNREGVWKVHLSLRAPRYNATNAKKTGSAKTPSWPM